MAKNKLKKKNISRRRKTGKSTRKTASSRLRKPKAKRASKRASVSARKGKLVKKRRRSVSKRREKFGVRRKAPHADAMSGKSKRSSVAVVRKSRKKSLPKRIETSPRRASSRKQRGVRPLIKIKVIGVGGGGGNAITRMRRNFSVRGVEFIAINTDLQDLESSDAHKKIHIGKAVTKGMGAGMNPDLGQQAAEESRTEIANALDDTDMVFITSGFGGGTGTGATPVIADITRELGILTVAVITKPFSFEGASRMKIAEDGVLKIKDRVDTLLVIPNDRIFSIIDKDTSVLKAFEKIDDILRSAVQGVAEIISSSGLVNVDFADIRSITAGAGMAVIGVGSAGGADRAVKAMNQAMNSPLLEISIDGARSVLFGVAGGRDMKMSEINEAAKIIIDNVDPGARIIFGAYHDRRLKSGYLKITLIATGFNGMLFKSEPSSLTLFNDDVDLLEDTDDEVENSSKSGKHGGTSEKGLSDIGENDEEILDTPTFLRRRGRRK